ncbi:peptide/nickel transport system ATP-binding protein [Butyrivibrio proteoclasticus]|uniref:Nickel import system ATP-binding protein NikD n=1 Tax=Butyrivibrio proteoclasticus TaxID=43305 RepID=A0A1I5X4X2_9FIRM|nr:ABC transporter ATP-binding protein [Butyrivibrio proteoclasticus]SFQ26974.1 peptide/nickel transport system ATP-binding protein [Butyrivibrio proteoclasticus]
MGKTLLNVEDLVVAFSMYRGDTLKKENLEVIHSLSLDVKEGEILAVVGSSGSGKSILASAVLDLLPKNAIVSGRITYDGKPLSMKTTPDLYGKEISFIPQSVDYLDPLMKVGKQVQGVKGSKARQEELFKKYRLGKDTEKKYPFQLSGGMARRVLISGAVMGNPKLIIADEPTPGLDLELAMETLKHFRTLADQGTGILMITHDIDLALNVADRIAVFYAGTIVEIASTQDFLSGRDALRHQYTKALYDALPQNGFKPIPGAQPYAGSLPSGCLFADRCPYRDDACAGEQPEREVRGGKVRCAHAT